MIFDHVSDRPLAPCSGGRLEDSASGQREAHLPIRKPIRSAAPLNSPRVLFIEIRGRIAGRIGFPLHLVELLRDTLPFLGWHAASPGIKERERKLSMGQTL
jgi:hypothetical protein